jgi:hypothetical protein
MVGVAARNPRAQLAGEIAYGRVRIVPRRRRAFAVEQGPQCGGLRLGGARRRKDFSRHDLSDVGGYQRVEPLAPVEQRHDVLVEECRDRLEQLGCVRPIEHPIPRAA